jgi:hypothetical protein
MIKSTSKISLLLLEISLLTQMDLCILTCGGGNYLSSGIRVPCSSEFVNPDNNIRIKCTSGYLSVVDGTVSKWFDIWPETGTSIQISWVSLDIKQYCSVNVYECDPQPTN